MAKLNIISIDPSLRGTGLCYRIDGQVNYCDLSLPDALDKNDALLELWCSVNYLLSTIRHKLDMGIVEGYSYGSRGNYMVDAGAVGGVVRLALKQNGVRFLEMAPATWKSIMFTGLYKNFKYDKTTKAGKALFNTFTKSTFELVFDSIDIGEAYLMMKSVDVSFDVMAARRSCVGNLAQAVSELIVPRGYECPEEQ